VAIVQVPNIIDIEASGFGALAYPIEVGYVLSNGERYCALIRPFEHWTHWSDDAEAVHKIPRQTLLERGKSPSAICCELNEQLQGATVYSDAWVVDKPWLNRLFHDAGIPMQFFISPIELILDERQFEHWPDVRDAVITEHEIERHRASNDAWIIQQTFLRLQQSDSTLLRY